MLKEFLALRGLLGGPGGGGGSGGSELLQYNASEARKDATIDDLFGLRILFSYVKNFGYECFYELMSIAEAVAPIAETVGNSAFGYCEHLKRIDMPSVTVVEEAGFVNCRRLANVNLPSVETIGIEAFAQCDGLEKIDLPKTTSIATMAFLNCDTLTTVILRTTEAVCVCALDAFEGTPIMQGMGHIYVPTVMYEYYRAGYGEALGYDTFAALFRKIEDYPEICG